MTTQAYGNWQKYQSKNPVQKALINRFLDQMRSLVEPLPVRFLLDAGCGEAFILSTMVQARSDLEVAVGIDIDRDALGRGHELSPDIPLIEADILHLPYPSDSFDIVVCAEVLEHLTNPDEALAELCRVSRKYCLLSVPHEPLFCLSNLLRGKNISRLGNDIEHYQNWSLPGFTAFAGNHLDVEVVKRSFPWQIVLGQVR